MRRVPGCHPRPIHQSAPPTQPLQTMRCHGKTAPVLRISIHRLLLVRPRPPFVNPQTITACPRTDLAPDRKTRLLVAKYRAIVAALRNGVLAQLVERLNGIEEVRGSNPLGSMALGRGTYGTNLRWLQRVVTTEPPTFSDVQRDGTPATAFVPAGIARSPRTRNPVFHESNVHRYSPMSLMSAQSKKRPISPVSGPR